MLKGLFGKKQVPTNEGSGTATKLDTTRWVKLFSLELHNMEGAPTYKLQHQLTIGSEIGDIIISDPSLSPRHCTFVLQQNVISLMDHGSISGTMVNDQKIPAGRYIILEETDTVMVGDLEVKFIVTNEVEAKNEQPQEAEEEEKVAKTEEKEVEEEEEVEEEVEEISKPDLKVPKSPQIPPLKLVENSNYSANSLIRVGAVISDLLLAYIIQVIFTPFDDFRAFLSFIPASIGEMLDVDWGQFWTAFNEDHGYLGEMLKDILDFLTVTFNPGSLLLIFILLRLGSTLLMGVSISEFIFGIKSSGNGIWKRVGGLIRVLIGIFTGPFIIFDLPAVISRRTFKEFMTGTRIFVRSKFIAVMSTILYVPLLVFIALLSPMYQGLEHPLAIKINDKVEHRMKVEGASEPKAELTQASRTLGFELTYAPEDVSIIPNFKFQGIKEKINLRSQLSFYHFELKEAVIWELFKTFDMPQLLHIGIKGNYFLAESYPELTSFAHNVSTAGFKTTNNPKTAAQFANEFIAFTKMAFELNEENFIEVMQSTTPHLKGLVDFKESFLSLIEYKDFNKIGFIKIGNATFMRISYERQKPFDLLIPLLKSNGKVFKVSFEKKETKEALSSKFYKYTFNKTDWFQDKGQTLSETMTSFQVYDSFTSLNDKKDLDPNRAEALYGYYYEGSAKVLSKSDEAEFLLWQSSLENLQKVLEALHGVKNNTDPNSEDPILKLIQKFREMYEAFEARNKEYFGVSESVVL